jgi:hypothetical protein
MSIRTAATGVLAALAAAAGLFAPAAASARQVLAAPPAYARPGACYAHVRRAARYAPPPGPRGAWRLTPPGPGQPGPTWCFVTEPGGPPVLLRPAVDGWVRVPCPRPRHVVHRPRPHPCGCRPAPRRHLRPHPRPHPRPVHLRPHAPCCIAPARVCCLLPTTPPPPPVVVYPAFNPALGYGRPGPKVLSWPGKTG